MNIYAVNIATILGVATFAWKIIAGIKSELQQCYEREALQNQKIEKCFRQCHEREALQNQNIEDCYHQIDILKYQLDGHKDIHSLLSSGLQQGIEHARARLLGEVKEVKSEMSQLEQKLEEITKIVYQNLD